MSPDECEVRLESVVAEEGNGGTVTWVVIPATKYLFSRDGSINPFLIMPEPRYLVTVII